MSVCARPPVDVEDLPGGWAWWDSGHRGRAGENFGVWQDTPGPAERTVDHVARRWSRHVTHKDCSTVARAAVEAWRAGEAMPGADTPVGATLAILGMGSGTPVTSPGEALNLVPAGLRSQALHRLGYTTRSHEELLGIAPGGGPGITVTLPVPPDDPEGWTEIPAQWRVLSEGWAHHAGRLVELRDRVARAAGGTPVLQGWEPVADPDPTAPWWLSAADWDASVDVRLVPPPSEYQVVTVRRQPTGRWSYGTGTGGHLMVRGEAPSEAEAIDAGRAVIAAEQAQAWERNVDRYGPEVMARSPWGITPPEPSVISVEPVGLAEIADRLGVARQTVDSWRTRGVLPAPTWEVGGRPAWDWETIRAWADTTGRT